MVETSVQSNNIAVKFRGKGSREMPSTSQAQNRFMHAVAEGDVPGVKPSVGKDFVKADEGRKIGKLPEHVKPKRKRSRHHRRIVRRAMRSGMISEKAMQKMMDRGEG